VTVTLHAASCGRQPAPLLRPWQASDIPGLLEIHRDPVMSQAARHPITTEQDAHRWLQAQQDGWAGGDRLSFAVLDQAVLDQAVLDQEAAGQPAGVLGQVALRGCAAGREAAEIGYWTAPAARGRGIASGAVVTVTAWAFQALGPLGLQRVDLIHQVDNPASCRVAQKSGYALAGVLPADAPAFPADGHLHRRSAPG
jgi:RimJ/RimL family protein N-acetyltransferase